MMGDQEIQVGVAQDQGGPLMLTAGGSGTAAQQVLTFTSNRSIENK